MITYINSVTLLGRNLSVDGITPEDLALRWILYDDPVFNTTESWQPIASYNETNDTVRNFAFGQQFRFIQRYSLLTLWFQQIDSNREFQRSWTSIDKWLIDRNECNWFGMKCFTIFIEENSVEVGVVSDIVFEGNNLTGTLSADLGLLSTLQHVVFSSYSSISDDDLGFFEYGFIGTLPSTIGQWTALTHFDFTDNIHIDGTLPTTIGQWTALQYFAFANNMALIGTLPSTIGQWAALTSFTVTTSLTGTLPSTFIGQWTALTFFLRNK